MLKKETNPLEDVFEPIDVGGYNEELEKTRIPPLEAGKYRFKVTDSVLGTSQRSSDRWVKFKCEVTGDSAEKNNGRKCQTRILMLEGPGFSFFLNFISIVTPSRIWSGKKFQIVKDYLDTFRGCEFLADVISSVELDSERKPVLDEDGNPKLTGFNEMTAMYSVR